VTAPDPDGVLAEEELLKLLRVAGDAVLVGGQALAFWVAYLDVQIPPGPRTFISVDADFLGHAEHVRAFSDAIGGRAEYASGRAIPALHGVVTKRTRRGDEIGVDVLGTVIGVEARGVRRRAIEVRHPRDADLRFLVMDPVDCMTSRLENLRKLRDKQNEIGVWQANISITVCRAYLGRLIARGDERGAIRAATRILGLAGTAPGLQAFRDHGAEPLDAIPIDRFASRPFREEQYARAVARIRAIRDAYVRPPAAKKGKPR
jgi:hypothetical protein